MTILSRLFINTEGKSNRWLEDGPQKKIEALMAIFWGEHGREEKTNTVEWFNVFLILILGSHMKLVKKEEELWN